MRADLLEKTSFFLDLVFFSDRVFGGSNQHYKKVRLDPSGKVHLCFGPVREIISVMSQTELKNVASHKSVGDGLIFGYVSK